MFVDLLGKTRIKAALHVKTCGDTSENDIAAAYIEHGYDTVALTENWKYTPESEIEGLKIISGCEYSVGGLGDGEEAYHILAIGMTSDPELPDAWKNMKKTARAKAAEIIKVIQKRNGIAIIAYPSHNRNRADALLDLEGFDGLEIFNSETEYGIPCDGYSGELSDTLSKFSVPHMLIASNGLNGYHCRDFGCSLMIEATDMDTGHILRAIRQGRFYSTEGPEIHIEKIGADKVRVTCSPASKIEFFSDMCARSSKRVDGENLIESEYVIKEGERYVRAEITDENGLRAWTNIIRFDELYR